MNLAPDIEKKIRELQLLEQNAQNLALQKQTTQVEFNEITNALAEIVATKDEVYRMLGSVMLRADKEKLAGELKERKHLLELRIQALEKQEKIIEDKTHKMRDEINASLKEPKKK